MLVRRPEHLAAVLRLLRWNPVVAVLGPRQSGTFALAENVRAVAAADLLRALRPL